MRDVRFSSNSFKEFSDWATDNKKAYQKLIELIEAARRTPFSGIGSPNHLSMNIKACGAEGIQTNTDLFIQFLKKKLL